MVMLARDGFADRWSDMASDVVTKNLLSSLELARPGTGERVLTTHLGRGTQAFFEVGHYRRLARCARVQEDRRSLGRRLFWCGVYLSGPSFVAATRSGLRLVTLRAIGLGSTTGFVPRTWLRSSCSPSSSHCSSG